MTGKTSRGPRRRRRAERGSIPKKIARVYASLCALPRLDHTPVVFVDTSVIKIATYRRIIPVRRSKTLRWGPREFTGELTQWVERSSVPKPNQAKDAARLPFLARLAIRGRLQFIDSLDVSLELWALPRTHNPMGPLYGAPVTHVPIPLGIGRTIASPGLGVKEHQAAFLRAFQDRGVRALAVATGGLQGGHYNDNQLADAFHIWCA